jgi:hypothetical protein
MAQWRSGTDRMQELERQLELAAAELQQYKEANQVLQQQYQALKVQNERLLKKEAEHQSAKKSIIQKRIIISRAVFLVPESLVIGDRLENCVIKIYRGNNVTITDTAELINCRIIGLEHYSDGRISNHNKHLGTIEIRGVFYNIAPRGFAISTHERVLINRGARVVGNIAAECIVINELTKVRGRLASRGLISQRTKMRELEQARARLEKTRIQKENTETEIRGSVPEPLQVSEIG